MVIMVTSDGAYIYHFYHYELGFWKSVQMDICCMQNL